MEESEECALHAQLSAERFDKLFQSPLRRSSDTAKIIWGPRSGPVTTLPSLREIDLYSFQASLCALWHNAQSSCAHEQLGKPCQEGGPALAASARAGWLCRAALPESC